MKRWKLAWVLLVVAAFGTGPAGAVDLTKVDRSIRREPEYRSKPKYCLLVFGLGAKDRAWLVLDGDTLYVDRNGNGDLTEEGERVEVAKWAAAKEHPAYSHEKRTSAGDLFLGGRTHSGLEVLQTQYRREINPAFKDNWQDYVDDIWHQTGDGITCMVSLELDPRCYQLFNIETNRKVGHFGGASGTEKGVLTFAPRPADAPILHFGGPLTFRVANGELRAGNTPNRFSVNLGTAGLGAGAFVVMAFDLTPDDVTANPVVEVEFPSRTRGQPPLVRKFVLEERCCGINIFGPVQVPDEAGSGKAKVTVSFPDWKEGKVAPAIYHLPVVTGDKKND